LGNAIAPPGTHHRTLSTTSPGIRKATKAGVPLAWLELLRSCFTISEDPSAVRAFYGGRLFWGGVAPLHTGVAQLAVGSA